MSKIKTCSCCGQKIVDYKHNINKTLVRCLSKLNKIGGKANLNQLGLTNTEFGNFQKLRYFKLISKCPESHVWTITGLGEGFLQGKYSVPKFVITRGGTILTEAHQKVFIHEIKECFQYKIEWMEQATQEKLFW